MKCPSVENTVKELIAINRFFFSINGPLSQYSLKHDAFTRRLFATCRNAYFIAPLCREDFALYIYYFLLILKWIHEYHSKRIQTVSFLGILNFLTSSTYFSLTKAATVLISDTPSLRSWGTTTMETRAKIV